jgi:phosphate transport system substrate-binding protein
MSQHRRLASLVPLVASLLFLPSGARADAPAVMFALQTDLGPTLTGAVQVPSGMVAGKLVADGAQVVCADQPSSLPRLAMVPGQPRPMDIDACRQSVAADVLAVTIGYQAVAVVTPATASVFPLQSADLFRAVSAHAGAQPVPAVWRDVDPNLPALPLGMLAPPADSASTRLLNAYVMEPACSQQDGARLPFEAASRIEFCGTLRADPAIVRRTDAQAIAAWAASAPAGQIAVVTLAELRKLDRAVVPLPLDGALPTAANIASGHYPAAEAVTLLIVVPHDIAPLRREATRRVVFELTSERSIGPDGSLAQAGLVPLPAPERVAARLKAVAFVEHP